jgi:DNA-binding beta-propeller fold protein YncE
VTRITSLAADNLQFPWDIVVDWANTIYVTNRYNHRVQKFLREAENGTAIADQASGISGSAANQWNQPTDIYVNSNGDIFWSDTNNNRIQFFSPGQSSGVMIAGITNIVILVIIEVIILFFNFHFIRLFTVSHFQKIGKRSLSRDYVQFS